jgi:hypothetical protein
VSRKTLELTAALSQAVHFPVGGRELTETLQGLLGKYRALIMQLQDELSGQAEPGLDKDGNVEQNGIQALQLTLANTRLELSTGLIPQTERVVQPVLISIFASVLQPRTIEGRLLKCASS